MKRYNELTAQEKLALTDEDVERYEAIELMIEGVAVPPCPVEPKQQVADILASIPSRTYFKIGDLVFDTMADAEKVLALKPAKEAILYVRYSGVYDAKYPDQDSCRKVETVTLYDPSAIKEASDRLITAQNSHEEYKKDKAAYTKAIDERAAVLTEMRDDLFEVRSHARELQRIRNVFAEYVKLADGERDTARRFLSKKYTESDIAEALGDESAAEAQPA